MNVCDAAAANSPVNLGCGLCFDVMADSHQERPLGIGCQLLERHFARLQKADGYSPLLCWQACTDDTEEMNKDVGLETAPEVEDAGKRKLRDAADKISRDGNDGRVAVAREDGRDVGIQTPEHVLLHCVGEGSDEDTKPSRPQRALLAAPA